MSEIEHYMDKVTEIAAERDVLRTQLTDADHRGDVLQRERDQLRVERDEAKKRVDFLNDRLDSVANARNKIEAERDALRLALEVNLPSEHWKRAATRARAERDDLQALVNELAANARRFYPVDLSARLDAAAKADQ